MLVRQRKGSSVNDRPSEYSYSVLDDHGDVLSILSPDEVNAVVRPLVQQSRRVQPRLRCRSSQAVASTDQKRPRRAHPKHSPSPQRLRVQWMYVVDVSHISAVAAGAIKSAKTSRTPTTCTEIVIVIASNSKKSIESKRNGTPRVAANSGSTETKSNGRKIIAMMSKAIPPTTSVARRAACGDT